jgi:signal transduction histidine kinase
LYKYDSTEEIIGKHFAVIQKIDDLEKAKEFVDGIMRGDARYLKGDFSRKNKDGSIGYHSFSARPVLRDGAAVGIEGFILDITEQKLAAEALRDSESRFRSLFEAMNEGVVLHEVLYDEAGQAVDYVILNVNPAFEKILNIPHDQAVGARASQLYGTGSAPYLDIYAEVAESGQSTTFEVYFAPMQKHFSISVVSPERGKFATIFEDITERKRTEDEIRSLNAELEERVAKRTTELEFANCELKDFAYVVSHDLKAPLRAISRLGDWLREDYAPAFDEKGNEMVDLLIGRVKRMDDLIDGILEYSRIGRIEQAHATVDLNRLVAEVLDSLAPPEHVHVTVAHELPTLIVSKTRMFQVFQNLIGNAIKFSDQSSVNISIDCVAENHFWKFSVADNGPGIDPKYHERIFQIFQTLRPRDEFESTGIGLTLVKKIIELYGGKIWVKSAPGAGCQMFFTLPQQSD